RALKDWLGRSREERLADTARPTAEELGALLAHFGFPDVKVVEPKRETVEVAPLDPEKLRPRVPVVTVMGHVDHGKTTLLDKIRSTSVAASEAGAITQAIGASVATTADGRLVTYIDTPGHHSFTAMRARGAQVTDVAVLVVAAEEGPREQTKEALEHIRAAGVEFVVAVNKMDHERANLDRALKGLQGLGIEPAQWGGDISCYPVSALTGEGVEELLEGILELADVLELRADPSARAQGVVVESFIRDGGRSASVVVSDGTLRPRDVILFDHDMAVVRTLIGPGGDRLEDVLPGLPAEIQGLASLPDPGERFVQVKNQKTARRILKDRQKGKKGGTVRAGLDVSDLFASGPDEVFHLLLKASSHGALEAVRGEIDKLKSEAVDVLVIGTGVGDITDADINLAHSAAAAVIGFEVGVDGKAAQNARSKGVAVDVYNLIYELVDKVRGKVLDSMSAEEEEVETGRLEVLAVFRKTSRLTIAGGKVEVGPLKRGSRCRLLRDGEVFFQGRVDNLKRFKEDVKEVREGLECGFRITGNPGVEPGDTLVAYEIRRTERTAKEVFGA
ncbi:translation initiation factor IF-2, partial [bacterium]|nr:translation initiation factor IF-2 [bacterium]